MPDEIDVSRILGQIETAIKPLPDMAKDLSRIQIKLAGLPCNEHTKDLTDIESRLGEVETSSAEMRPMANIFWRIIIAVLTATVLGCVVWANYN